MGIKGEAFTSKFRNFILAVFYFEMLGNIQVFKNCNMILDKIQYVDNTFSLKVCEAIKMESQLQFISHVFFIILI